MSLKVKKNGRIYEYQSFHIMVKPEVGNLLRILKVKKGFKTYTDLLRFLITFYLKHEVGEKK